MKESINQRDLEIIDAHMHLWNPLETPHPLKTVSRLLGRYPRVYDRVLKTLMPRNMHDSFGSTRFMRMPYLPEDYQKDIGRHKVTGAVFMPYAWNVKNDEEFAGETLFANKLFQGRDGKGLVNLQAIVGQAHFSSHKDLPAVIEAHMQASNKLVGLREMLSWHDDPGLHNHADKPSLSRDPEWRKGFAHLASHNLLFEAVGFYTQLPELSELAKEFPDTSIVLGHMGMPVALAGPYANQGHDFSARREIFLRWKDGISAIAENKNVSVKISGMFMPIMGWGLHRGKSWETEEILEQLRPVVDHLIDQFGVRRCMFASHCPPDKVSMSFSDLYDIYKKLVAHRSLYEQKQLFSETAREIYQPVSRGVARVA